MYHMPINLCGDFNILSWHKSGSALTSAASSFNKEMCHCSVVPKMCIMIDLISLSFMKERRQRRSPGFVEHKLLLTRMCWQRKLGRPVDPLSQVISASLYSKLVQNPLSKIAPRRGTSKTEHGLPLKKIRNLRIFIFFCDLILYSFISDCMPRCHDSELNSRVLPFFQSVIMFMSCQHPVFQCNIFWMSNQPIRV